MATLVHTYRSHSRRIVIIQKLDRAIMRRLPRPRRCMVLSVSLILAGLGIPALMAIGLLPLMMGLFFLGFAMTAIGSLSAFIFCGEL